jgi:hypothetical protein
MQCKWSARRQKWRRRRRADIKCSTAAARPARRRGLLTSQDDTIISINKQTNTSELESKNDKMFLY